MVDYCKYCKSTDLELIENYEYSFECGEKELITAIKCGDCECVHKVVEDNVEFYEFPAKGVKEHNKSGDWKI